MNPSTSTKFALLQKLLFNRLIYSSRAASFLPNDVLEESSLREEIPQKEPKYVHEMVGRKLLIRAVYGAGLCSTGALAVERLLTQSSLKQWGQNEYGQMCSITDEPQIFLPQQVPFKLGKVVRAEATGISCIVCNSDGEVFTWGSYVLGFGPKIEKLTKPMQIDPPLFTSAMNEKNSVVKVFAGGSCMGALSWTFGFSLGVQTNMVFWHSPTEITNTFQKYFPALFSDAHFTVEKANQKDSFKILNISLNVTGILLYQSIVCFHYFGSFYVFLQYICLDVVSLLEFLRLPESWIQKIRDLPKSAGTMTIALILYKALTPIRYSSTLFCTYKIVKLLRKK